MFHTYLILKFYYLGLPQKNILYIRVTNTPLSHPTLKVVQLAIAIAWVVLNMVLFIQSGFMQ